MRMINFRINRGMNFQHNLSLCNKKENIGILKSILIILNIDYDII